ncbi:unnamed protein product [Bemisia tabaci]|uniref:Uncharacterized protein n=1 Tax=Bemisia tabaci TaxID=7038 RepID=A0A9P0C4F9_BEMTA|nr:unnamed protein product [Bemisia tabaci]
MGTPEDAALNSDAESDPGSDLEDPEKLLETLLGELGTLTEGLDNVGSNSCNPRPASDLNPPRTDTYRLSMANLEDTQDVDLDAILGELCALESQYDKELSQTSLNKSGATDISQHRRSPSEAHGVARTDSPDNDSAFSDSVSLLSSESSASSGRTDATASSSVSANQAGQNGKTEKIRLALQKMREANIKKIFIKVFSLDGSAKSLLVDESMTCGYVTRLLAEKNHTSLEPSWGLVEYVNDLHMERVYEDHEMLVNNLMLWTRDSQNKLYFVERPERTLLFKRPELFHNDHLNTPLIEPLDEFTKNSIIEELLSGAGGPNIEGSLYIKTESRKGWKKYQSILRASGLYYLPKDKSSSRSPKDMICLTKFENNEVYYGVGWKKKLKAPTEFGFAIKHPCLQQPKSSKHIKYLCAEDSITMHRWVIAIRIVKYGRQLYDNYRSVLDGDEVDNEILDQSDSGSSGCDVAFESDFPSGTIKRKPPKIPLTQTTRQLKDIASSNSNMFSLRREEEIYSTAVLDRSNGLYGNVDRRLTEEPLDVNHCSERRVSVSIDIANSPKERLVSNSLERNNIYGNCATLKRQSSLDKNSIGTDRRTNEISVSKHQNSLDKNSHRLGSGEFIESAILTRPIVDNKPNLFVEREIDEAMIERSPSFSSLPPPPPELLASSLTLNEDDDEVDLPPPPPPRLLPPSEDFLQDLQRVMRRKWQVAQKCKLDVKMTPHEVLGFRDPPPGEADYRETNVSNWVQEHYGSSTNSSQYNLYENIFAKSTPNKSTILNTNSNPGTHKPKTVTFNLPPSPVIIPDSVPIVKKRPPPPPPRAETTQLTTKLPPKQPC